ncbi:ligand-binding sensor domain-containing protein [Foetidibacter luteolus]|uniref:ligand-binding sensor domain-containing protein n=1 Tax=Foetidibacter luteolus TaxID=2608880 RepID=UPI001A994446|nr:sensor histidine kinase [Foetidibacter luteolus]
MKRKFCLLTAVYITACLWALGQPYYFRHYQVENGLSNSTVFCSIQDRNGFMWFGTKEGLNRFDGYRFKLFDLDSDNDRTLTPDLIFCLFTDTYGTLWIGGEKGLYQYLPATEQLVRHLDSLPNVSALQMDKLGNLWLLSNNNIYRYNLVTRQCKRFSPTGDYNVTSLLCADNGIMWFTTNNGYLLQFNAANESFARYDLFNHSPIPASRWVQKIAGGPGNTLFVGTTTQGLKQFDVAALDYTDVITYNPDKTNVFVRDILKNRENEYWFATESGVFILNTATGKYVNLKKKFLDPYSLSDNAVYSLSRDTEGGIWAGTFFGGINYYTRQYGVFQKYFPDNTGLSISGNAVREICADNEGNLWIGTEDQGLNKLNKTTGAITHFEPTGKPGDIAYYNIHGLLVVGNQLWIGTFEHGLDVMDIATGKIVKRYKAGPGPLEMKSNFPLCFVQTKTGEIYTGTSNGLYHYNKKADGFEKPAELNISQFFATIIEDHTGTIWAGSRWGVFWFNPVTHAQGHHVNDPNNKNSLSNNNINALFEDSNHHIWIATEGGGLCKLDADRKTFTRYSTKNGLPSNFIFKVLEDDEKNLWVTTSRGLVNFNPANSSAVVYTNANGLLNDQFNYHSGFKDTDGTLYFGSVKGMISFTPASFAQKRFIPPIYITGLQVHNEEWPILRDSTRQSNSIVFTDKIVLPYDKSSFSIDFAALSYTSPGMTAYKYRMDGLDKDWTYLPANRKVYFTNIAPGRYIFRLTAAADRHWNNYEKQLMIEILPPFWKTTWAYLLYTVLAAVLVWYLVRSYHRRIEIKKEKEIYESKIDFFTNVAHEIRTPLTLIKGPVENLMEKIDETPGIKEDVKTMERNTNRLVALVTQILDFRQTETRGFSLAFEEVNITRLLQEEYQDFTALARKRNLVYSIDVPATPIVAMADEEALNKIFSNLFSNAVKYAAKEVQVKLLPLQKEDTHFTVEISNDGFIIPAHMREKIFEPFYRLKENLKQKGTGIGLTLARSLAELHNGTLYLKEPVTAFNTFVLCLPLQPATGKTSAAMDNQQLAKTK